MTGLKSGSGDDLWDDEENERNDTAAETDRDGTTAASSSGETGGSDGRDEQRPYIVRRALQDRSIQFERDERLTFFVHDDIVEGERKLIGELETELGRDVPKFDVREAVYRAALRNRDDVLAELLKMGYTRDK